MENQPVLSSSSSDDLNQQITMTHKISTNQCDQKSIIKFINQLEAKIKKYKQQLYNQNILNKMLSEKVKLQETENKEYQIQISKLKKHEAEIQKKLEYYINNQHKYNVKVRIHGKESNIRQDDNKNQETETNQVNEQSNLNVSNNNLFDMQEQTRISLLEKENQELKDLFSQIKEKWDLIHQVLNIDPENIEGDWSVISSYLKSHIDSQKNPKTIEKLEKDLINEKDFSNRLQTQLMFSRAIIKAQHPASNILMNLHSMIKENTTTPLRSIIFATIFTLRFKTLGKSKPIIDIYKLNKFTGREIFSYSKQGKELKHFLINMNNTLNKAKQDLENEIASKTQSEYNMELLQNEKLSKESLLESSNKKINELKEHIKSLEQEINNSLSMEQCQKLFDKNQRQKAKIQELINLLKLMNNQVESKDKTIDSLNSQIMEYKVQSSMKKDQENLAKETIQKQEDQIESLNILLNERTKEILALERNVNRQKNINETMGESLMTLNQHNFQFNGNYKPLKISSIGCANYGKMLSINPAFM